MGNPLSICTKYEDSPSIAKKDVFILFGAGHHSFNRRPIG